MKRMRIVMVALAVAFFVQSAQAQWTTAKRLTWTSGWSEWPALAIDSGDKLHAVWADNTTGHYEVYYKKSTDLGSSWTTTRRLTWASAYFGSVAIAVGTTDHIHLVWQDTPPGNGEIYYKKSTDGGSSWTASKRLTWNSGSSEDPAIAVDSQGALHVVWEDYTPGESEIYHKKSTDGGVTWTANQRLTWTPGSSWHTAVVTPWSGGLYVVWEEYSGGSDEVYFRKSTDGGVIWSASQKVTWTSGNSASPALGVDFFGHLHLAWVDDTPGDIEVYYRKSTNGGASWAATRRLTWASGYSDTPALAVDSSGNPYVVWEDDASGKEEIYYRKSMDGGTTWAASQRLTWNSGYSFGPAIAIDSPGFPHVLWWDDTPGNFEIYYKRSK